MSYDPPPPPNPTNRTLILVVAILAGVIFLGVGSCATVGLLGLFWTNRTMEAREQAEVAHAEAQQAEAAERIGAMRGMASPLEHAYARSTVDQFLRFVREDRLDDAYGLATVAFKKQRDREAFGKFIAEHPGFQKEVHPNGVMPPETPGDKAIRLRYLSSMADGVRVEIKFTLGKENEFWLIDKIDISEHKLR